MLFPHVSEEVVDQLGHQSSWVVDPGNQLGNYLIHRQGEERERGRGHRMCHYIIPLVNDVSFHNPSPIITCSHVSMSIVLRPSVTASWTSG